MNRTLTILISSFFAISVATTVHGEVFPCAPDLEKNPEIFEEVKANRDALYSILTKNSASLSKECRAHIAKIKGLRSEMLVACAKEMNSTPTCQLIKKDEQMYTPPAFWFRKCIAAPEVKASIDCRAKGYEVSEDLFGVESKNNRCMEDQNKFCKEVIPGKMRMAKCLFVNLEVLSFDCRAFKFHLVTGDPCYRDILKYCADIKPGDKRIETCLMKNIDALSATCKTYIAPEPPRQ